MFSGCTPGKILHFLNCLQVACITDRAFYLHQTQYLEPAGLSVWYDRQHQLLSATLKQGSPFIIGGDERADSPGHPAKFGSYGILNTKFYILTSHLSNSRDVKQVFKNFTNKYFKHSTLWSLKNAAD